LIYSYYSFSEHTNSVLNKGSAILGFIKRLSQEFRDPYTLTVLYVTYFRSKLEDATYINRFERIQENFIKHALRQFRWNVNIDLPDSPKLLSQINLGISVRRISQNELWDL
jgi:hypothetical protein